MSSPLISQIFICLGFIIFPSIIKSENYIQQVPSNLKRKVGESASIQCSIKDKIDVRTISLYQRKDPIIFTLRINQSNLSDSLEVSGTYDKFTWILNQVKYTCPNEHSLESGTIACLNKNSKIYLSDGTEEKASFWVNDIWGNRSRIQLSGTIRSLTITMTDLRKSDQNCYTCRGTAEHIERNLIGTDTCLTIENSHQCFTGSKVSIALGVVIVTVLLW